MTAETVGALVAIAAYELVLGVLVIASARKHKEEGTEMVENLIAPVEIGDKVHYLLEDDETGVVSFVPYRVCGVAYIDGKWYAVDHDGDLNECNTRWCVIGYRGAEHCEVKGNKERL